MGRHSGFRAFRFSSQRLVCIDVLQKMELLVSITLPLLLCAIGILIFASAIYGFRRLTIRSDAKMKRFLDKRFDVIRKKGFWGKERQYIDENLIRSWGKTGWCFIGLPAINLSLGTWENFSVWNSSSIVLLFFGGLFLGDSYAAVYFLKRLGFTRYSAQRAEQVADGQLPARVESEIS